MLTLCLIGILFVIAAFFIALAAGLATSIPIILVIVIFVGLDILLAKLIIRVFFRRKKKD